MSRLILLLVVILLLGCRGNEDRDAMVDKLIADRVQAKLDIYIQAELSRCLKELYDDASRTADSLLRLDPVQISLDSLKRPPTPLKPHLPAFKRKVDSIEIAPLFPGRNDTLKKVEGQ